ncbi:MAG: hypothetical protein RQ741_03885 [Wenzhouxiangellaceae bacterium]|nr:hypothetical protein [Wenzhouxiangellaceae bacterium]
MQDSIDPGQPREVEALMAPTMGARAERESRTDTDRPQPQSQSQSILSVAPPQLLTPPPPGSMLSEPAEQKSTPKNRRAGDIVAEQARKWLKRLREEYPDLAVPDDIEQAL